MKAKIAFSQKKDITTIIEDIQAQLNPLDAKMILFFASSNIEPLKISSFMQAAFSNIPVIGCSSSGEIVSGKMLDDSIVVMALGNDIIKDVKIEILTKISSNKNSVDKAFASFEMHYQGSMSSLDPCKYVGILLIDGLSMMEEKINERIGDLTNVAFIGGSAGDDLKFKKTFIYYDGKTYSNAALLALIQSNTEFDVLKTQSFIATDRMVKITKANEAKRTVIELNGKPAVKEYARLVNKDEAKLSEAFTSNPLGLLFEKDIFVRSPQKVDGNNVDFYCSIKKGMELCVLESTSIIEDTKNALVEKIKSFGNISALLNFNCILRTLELKDQNRTNEYGELFKDTPTIGLSTYGESYIGHINQTSVMLLFK